MKVLLVEDAYKIANAIKKGLEQESFAVDIANNGEDGIGSAFAFDYDLIILDRMLPGDIDGIRICKALRDKGMDVPVLILTAKDKIEDRVEGLDTGADDYLVKPFAFEELIARIKALLRRPKKNIGTVLQIEDLTLDTVNFKIERAGNNINLSNKEYSLLEYLMRNANRTLTKESIINNVWDFDADILPNTVEVFIGYLRNKIDKPFKGKKLIHTIRGFGYRIGDK